MISFKSQITQKVLNYFFLNPQVKMYIRELARVLELDPKNLDTKLKELETEGVLKSEFLGKQRYFSLASGSPLIKTYKELLAQTSGLEARLRVALKKVHGLREVYIYGSYAKNTMDAGSDIDILAVGEQSAILVQKAIRSIQKSSGREINVVNITESELEHKKRGKNPFISNVFRGKTIKLL